MRSSPRALQSASKDVMAELPIEVAATRDRELVRSLISGDRSITAHALCDLDDGEFPRTRCYVARRGGEAIALGMEYSGWAPQPLHLFGEPIGIAAILEVGIRPRAAWVPASTCCWPMSRTRAPWRPSRCAAGRRSARGLCALCHSPYTHHTQHTRFSARHLRRAVPCWLLHLLWREAAGGGGAAPGLSQDAAKVGWRRRAGHARGARSRSVV